jgi:crossover junction endodeoxyribonuclease RuvC
MRVLGLDPGTERTGWGCVRQDDDGELVRVASGVLRAGNGPLPERLRRLHVGLDRIFDLYRPDVCATEGLFYSRNARSALLLGHARGICLLVAAAHAVPVSEYAPAKVKRAIVGHGSAEKHQVGAMVASLLRFVPEDSLDETDALAVALCHLEMGRPLPLME